MAGESTKTAEGRNISCHPHFPHGQTRRKRTDDPSIHHEHKRCHDQLRPNHPDQLLHRLELRLDFGPLQRRPRRALLERHLAREQLDPQLLQLRPSRVARRSG